MLGQYCMHVCWRSRIISQEFKNPGYRVFFPIKLDSSFNVNVHSLTSRHVEQILVLLRNLKTAKN